MKKVYLDRFIFIVLIVGFPLVALSLARAFFSGWENVFLLHACFLVVIGVMHYTHSSYNVKAAFLILIANLLSVGNMFTYQLWGSGAVGFVAAIVMCGLFFDLRYAIINAVGVLLATAYYFYWIAGLPLQLDRVIYPIDVVNQFTVLLLFVLPIVYFFSGIMSEKAATDKELEDQLDKVKRAEAAKTSFLANTSHEMRTPLNAILGAIELLDSTNLTKQQKEYLSVSQSAGKSLRRVIDDVLDMVRIEAGETEIAPSWFNPNTLLEDVASLFAQNAKQSGIRIKVDVGSEVPRRVYGDTDRIKQVLVNLMSNALKFTQQGNVTTSLQYLKANNVFRFTVTDTGIGIPKEIGDDVFDVFSQVDSSIGRKHQGSGLGLAISRHLVFAMKGQIDYQSKPNEGSSFWFDLHLDSDDRPEESINDKAPEVPESAIQLLSERAFHVLLAEDSTANSFILRTYLEMAGHSVDLASNGIEALALAERSSYDAILMDLSMPEMDGLEATRILRTNGGENQDTPIIALTAHVLKEIRAECIEAGMTNFLAKPVSKENLLMALEQSIPAN